MAYFPNFAETARLGFQSGMEIGQGQNPLGSFVRSMLADWQQRRNLQTEISSRAGLEVFKSGLEEQTQIAKEKREQENPITKAKTRAYEALTAQRERGTTKGVSDVQKFKLQVYKQADSEAFKEAGGSLMVGIGSKKTSYIQRRKELYQQYLKQFDITDLSEPDISNSGIESIIPQEETELIDYDWE